MITNILVCFLVHSVVSRVCCRFKTEITLLLALQK